MDFFILTVSVILSFLFCSVIILSILVFLPTKILNRIKKGFLFTVTLSAYIAVAVLIYFGLIYT